MQATGLPHDKADFEEAAGIIASMDLFSAMHYG